MLVSIEIIALALIILAAIKMIVLWINPKSWMNFTKKVWSNLVLVQVVSFVLAVIVLYCLLQYMTIVQILAVVAFVGLLMVFGIAPEMGFLLKKYETLIKQGKLWEQYWFYTIIWIVLLGWGAYSLLG